MLMMLMLMLMLLTPAAVAPYAASVAQAHHAVI